MKLVMMLLHIHTDADGSISVTIIFQSYAVTVDDEYNFSRHFSILKIVFINNILHLQIQSSASHDIISCGNNSSYS